LPLADYIKELQKEHPGKFDELENNYHSAFHLDGLRDDFLDTFEDIYPEYFI
jgi:hypothetical protein